ncbi:MAG: DUF58 domain-containing protein [Candidatus Hodarchaeales archaeon]|jgi:uncharacterized protein (DUF58 family)
MAFSSRGRGLIIGGILLMSIGLSLGGMNTLTTMLPFLFGGTDNELFSTIADIQESNGTSQFPPGLEILQFFDIQPALIDYSMFLGTIMLLAVVVGLPWFRRKANTSTFRISRSIDREKSFAGEFIHISVKITNTSGTRHDMVEIYDAIPESFELAMGENFIIAQIGGGETKEFSYVLRVPVRGVYRIGPTKIILHDRIGFFYEEDIREFYTEVLVYPSYQDIRRMEALSKKRQIGKMFGSHKTREKGTGDDFHALRKFFPGDSFKSIDWKAFGKTGDLMVREFEAEKNIRIVVFLDHSSSMGGGIPNNSKLDFAIRSVMLLMSMAEENKDVAGLCTFSNEPTSWLPPGGKKGLLFQMLEVLALVEPRGQSNPLAAVEYVLERLPRNTFYIFITDLESANVGDFVEAAKRAISSKNKLVVISPLGPLFEATQDLTPIERAMAEAIMEEFVQQRKIVEDALRSMDVDILNVGPEDMLPEVIKQYQKGKARGYGLM